MDLKSALKRLFGKRPSGGTASTRPVELPMTTVTHDSVDTLRFKSHIARLPRFARIVKEGAPVIRPDVVEPEPLDFAAASAEEIAEWQQQVRKARDARKTADPYPLWDRLCEDLWYAYHHPQPPDIADDGFDPRVELHARIMRKVMAFDDYAETRQITRDDATMTAATVMHGAEAHLKPLLEQDLVEQVRQAQQASEQMQAAGDAADQLQDMRGEVRQLMADGQPIPDDLRDAIKALVKIKRDAMDKAEEIMAVDIPMNQAAHDRIKQLTKSVKETAQSFSGTPHFGQGFGRDEPVYESPEQALEIAERWSRNPLKGIADRYGRFDPDMRFKRAKRIVGGQEEIVDVEFSDNLKRATFGELARLALDDEDYFDEFVMKYLTSDLLTFQTVGEEHAGRGPAGLVVDGSSSMRGERNMFARATALAVLNMCRRDKRDMFVVEFSSVNQMASWTFPAKESLDAERILEMASHFFSGTTHPLVGIAEAERIMKSVPMFRKADIVLLTDGECSFGDEDRRTRQRLVDMGVRLHGIGIGKAWGYLKKFVSDEDLLCHVLDFELGDPNIATTQLATHIS